MAAPFPSLGPPRRVPQLQRYYGAVRLPVPLSPRFVAFAWRYPASRLSFAPSRPGRPTAGLGFVIRSPCRKDTQGDKQGLPGSRTTRYPYALFFDPGRTEHVRPLRRVGMAPAMSTAKAPTNQSSFRGSIARLRDSLFTLRPMQLPAPDAKLASGRWPSATGRDWLPAGLLRKVSDVTHPPLPSFPGARTSRFSLVPQPTADAAASRTGRTAGS